MAGSKWFFWLSCCGFVVVLSAIGWRIAQNYQEPGPFDSSRQGFCDFHNGVYYPALAVRDGISPFGQRFEDRYPIARPIAIHSPYLFALHIPYTWLPLRLAEYVHFGVMAVELLLLAWLSLRVAGIKFGWSHAIGLATVLAASRSGYGTLFTGYFTLELVLGAALALHFGNRHWLGPFGFVLCCAKPTYGIPLTIMMAARGQFRALSWGLAIAGILTLLVTVWLLSTVSVTEFLAEVKSAQETHRADPNELPENSWTRVDLLGIVAKWIRWAPGDWDHLVWMLPLMAIPAWVLWRAANSEGGEMLGLDSPAGLLASLLIVIGIYHQYYDLLVLSPGLLAAGFSRHRAWGWVPRWQRMAAVGIGVLVLFNYSSAQFILGRLEMPRWGMDLVTSMNAVLLLVLTVWALFWTHAGTRSQRLARI